MQAYLLWLLLFLQATVHSPEAALERLRSRVAVAAVTERGEALAGRYARGTGLSGEDLHLFSDGTYLYCEWADIQPTTVYDKGRWRVAGVTVELASDPEITWEPGAERRHLLLRRAGRKGDALLIGLERALGHFESQAKEDPNHMLLVVGLLRTERYGRSKEARVRTQLMRDAWYPEYHR